jgi:hypothetical protein
MSRPPRPFSPVEAAQAVAQYFPADPAVWLDCCALVGVYVETDGQGLCVAWVDAEPGQATFLNSWLALTPGGTAAVVALLRLRAESRAA